MTTETRDELTERVIGLAMKVHRALGPGFVEFVYRNALIHELRKAAIAVEAEKPLKVHYENVIVGEFNADLVVANWLICELKAVSTLIIDHEIQLINYLSAVNHEFGLLINFGAKSLQVKRKYKRRISDNEPPDLHT
ncbi:MAG: GxxExxY protein [Chthoniobacteraceae bacterium]|nr:GxxExxY protein [Chthoniobacteraceae bacterium]